MQFDTASQNQIYQVKSMRRLFSDKAGATFNENLPSVTVNVPMTVWMKNISHLTSAFSHLLD